MCCTSDGGWRRVGHILPRILSVAGPNENSQRFSNQCISFVVRGARLLAEDGCHTHTASVSLIDGDFPPKKRRRKSHKHR